uniref:M48 family metallopeptidase n=1 Tax=uncultured Bilophila sp. TaxID=529385 RepID=UPI0025F0149A|nr:SprT family zinc-dependent metalloprotease [uncultured Bilophila sp.]
MRFPFVDDRAPDREPNEERFVWNGETIAFCIRRGSARRKRTAIRITREGTVEVLLPPRAPRRLAFAAVQERGDWIVRHVRDMERRPRPTPLRYADGEEHLFLGETYRLKLVPWDDGDFFFSGAEKNGRLVVTGTSQLLCLRVRSAAPEAVHKRLFLWYKVQIQNRIEERLSEICPRIPWIDTVPAWRVRVMRRRWGSCTSGGVLTLNVQLIKAPPQCLDYVLLHELAHLREHNHSKRYYAVLERLLPEWKAVRRELNAWAPLILR